MLQRKHKSSAFEVRNDCRSAKEHQFGLQPFFWAKEDQYHRKKNHRDSVDADVGSFFFFFFFEISQFGTFSLCELLTHPLLRII